MRSREEFKKTLEKYVMERSDWEENEIVKRAEVIMRAVENVIKYRSQKAEEGC